jgi:hypothetical protein
MKEKSVWIFMILIFAGIIFGGLLGEIAGEVEFLKWLAYGKDFGITEPFLLDLSVLKLSFSIMFDLNVASVIGILLAIFIYRKI